MKQQLFNIIFSIVLLPINIYCAFWLFREALNLTNMTFREFSEKIHPKMSQIKVRRHRKRKVQRLLAEFFFENSSDPEKSIKLTRAFGFCTLPSLASLSLAVYTAVNTNNFKHAFICNIILVALNILILVVGKSYTSSNSQNDNITYAKSRKKKTNRRKIQVKNIIVYSIVGVLFLGVFLFFMMGIAGISRSQEGYGSSKQSAISIQADLISILTEKGYTTSNIPTTYWKLDEHKLEHTAAGIKGKNKFEFYGYSDDKTVDLVYNRIVHLTAPNLENSEKEKHETTLSDGNKMFTIEIDNIYYFVMYRNDTVIYAYSPDSLNDINEILTEIGYSKNKD